MVEAAKGIGLTKWQVLTKVKIPMALPVIMAGVRISAVTAVGLMTMAAFIGAGGLGYLVFLVSEQSTTCRFWPVQFQRVRLRYWWISSWDWLKSW